MRKLFLGVGLALLVSTPVMAQTYSANPKLAADARLVEGVTIEDLKAIVVSAGYKIDALNPVGDVSIRGKSPEGLVFLLIGTACQQKVCQGIMMQIRYDTDERVTMEKINKANLAEAAVSAWFDREDKTMGISRYVVLDHGVTMANIKANLEVLIAIAPAVVDITFSE